MQLFQIVLPVKDQHHLNRFRQLLHNELEQMKRKDVYYQIQEHVHTQSVHFYCQSWPKCEYNFDTLDAICHSISMVVAEYIVEYGELEIIQSIISQEFHYDTEDEIEEITRYTKDILNTYCLEDEIADDSRLISKYKIFKKAYEYLMNEHVLMMDGFVRFRIKDYWEELRRAVEHGIDEYLMEKEYQEFIQLLRYFVSIQESRLPLLHVIHFDDLHFFLFDHKWKRIDPDQIEGLTQENLEQVNYEDLIISILICLAPEHIFLHTQQESHNIIYTIKSIFEKKVEVCIDCIHCRHWIKQLDLPVSSPYNNY